MSGNQNNPNQNNQQDAGGGCLGWALEWAVFILGAVLMFAKTAELLSAFAPKEWLGYVGIESLYGAVSAVMVEGLFVAIKLANDPVLNGRTHSLRTWITNAVVMTIPFLISIFAQPIDAFVVQGTLSEQPAEVQLLVSWGVPMVPGLIVGMILVKSLIASLPVSVLAKFGERPGGQVKLPKVNLSGFNPFGWFKGNGKERRGHDDRRDKGQQQKPPQKQEQPKPDPTPASTGK